MTVHGAITTPATTWTGHRVLARTAMGIVGFAFLVAGFLKAADSSSVSQVLLFDGLGSALPVLLWIIPLWEILIGAALILNLQPRMFILLSLGTLLVFTAQLVFLMVAADAPDCGCFALLSKHVSAQWSHAFGICRNLIMATALICSWISLNVR